MDYKELVESLKICNSGIKSCNGCKYDGTRSSICFGKIMTDATNAITELREKLKNAEAERDAAIDCLHKCCTENGLCYGCNNWNCAECNGGNDMWEWSGLF